VALFGELCGGKYPHPAVVETCHARPVQVGVWYSPSVEFILFDIAATSHGTCTFMAFKSVVDLATKHKLLCVPVLLIGSRGLCANFDPKFETHVPSRFGLPAIPGNYAEGIVAKPWCQSTSMEERPILKIKTHEFSEGVGSRPLPGDAGMRDYLLSQVNGNRLDAAASKVGHVTDRNNWSEIVDHVMEDILQEVGEDTTFLAMQAQLRCETFDLLVAQQGKDS